MTLQLAEIFTILIVHWFADFLMQDEKWALGKSKNWKDLLSHTFTYSWIWVIPICIMLGYTVPGQSVWFYTYYPFLFALITFMFHTATDYFTSRIVSKKFAKGEYGSAIPNTGAFTIIGIDQVLHYVQLFLTYYALK